MHTKRATAGVAVIAVVLAGCGGSSSRADATTAATITLTGPTRFARHDRPFWDAVAFSFRWG